MMWPVCNLSPWLMINILDVCRPHYTSKRECGTSSMSVSRPAVMHHSVTSWTLFTETHVLSDVLDWPPLWQLTNYAGIMQTAEKHHISEDTSLNDTAIADVLHSYGLSAVVVIANVSLWQHFVIRVQNMQHASDANAKLTNECGAPLDHLYK